MRDVRYVHLISWTLQSGSEHYYCDRYYYYYTSVNINTRTSIAIMNNERMNTAVMFPMLLTAVMITAIIVTSVTITALLHTVVQ
jgi:hypothetical protein